MQGDAVAGVWIVCGGGHSAADFAKGCEAARAACLARALPTHAHLFLPLLLLGVWLHGACANQYNSAISKGLGLVYRHAEIACCMVC